MYKFDEIEKKWQKYWEENGCFVAKNGGDKKTYYILIYGILVSLSFML